MAMVQRAQYALGHGARSANPMSYGNMAMALARNTTFRRYATRGLTAAATRMQQMWRDRRSARAARVSANRPAPRARGLSGGAANSASHGGTTGGAVRRRYGRKPMYNRYGKTRGGKRRRGGRRRKGGVLGTVIKMFTTPQITRTTRAQSHASSGYGVRTWAAYTMNSFNDLADMWDRRPGRIFNASNAGVANIGVAGNQMAVGNYSYMRVDSFWQKYTFQNRSNWDMELKVYECVVRKNAQVLLTTATLNTILHASYHNDYT